MKAYKKVIDQLHKNFTAIKETEAEILRLDYSAERRDAVQAKEYAKIKELREKANNNAELIAALSEELYLLKIENRVLQDNACAALFAEAYPVIVKACEKYNGKPYGEKTREAIREEVTHSGVGFYFDRNGYIQIYALNDKGYYSHGTEVKGVAVDAAGHYAEFITEENKINIANVTGKPRAKYTENTKAAARKIAKAIKSYSEATKKLEAQRSELIDILPPGIEQPDYIREYYLYLA